MGFAECCSDLLDDLTARRQITTIIAIVMHTAKTTIIDVANM
jgi:hypothetical protein